MPGRYTITAEKEEIIKRYSVLVPDEFSKRYNISPTQKVPVILNISPEKVVMAKWGFSPKWLKHPVINARSEDIEHNRMFGKAFRERRCLIVADSYYEWENTPEGKIPYRIMMKDSSIFSIAGVWIETEDGIEVATITIEPNKMISRIHDRMPAILRKEDEGKWLGEEGADTKFLLTYDENEMKLYKVDTKVNSSKHDTSDMINPVNREVQKSLF